MFPRGDPFAEHAGDEDLLYCLLPPTLLRPLEPGRENLLPEDLLDLELPDLECDFFLIPYLLDLGLLLFLGDFEADLPLRDPFGLRDGFLSCFFANGADMIDLPTFEFTTFLKYGS